MISYHILELLVKEPQWEILTEENIQDLYFSEPQIQLLPPMQPATETRINAALFLLGQKLPENLPPPIEPKRKGKYKIPDEMKASAGYRNYKRDPNTDSMFLINFSRLSKEIIKQTYYPYYLVGNCQINPTIKIQININQTHYTYHGSLDNNQQQQLENLLKKNQDLFISNLSELKQTNIIEHSIELEDKTPIKHRPY